MAKNLLDQLDRLNEEIGNVSEVIEKSEQYFKFSEYLSSRHIDSNVICDINRYQNITQVDPSGIITIADNLLQIRYSDANREKIKMEVI